MSPKIFFSGIALLSFFLAFLEAGRNSYFSPFTGALLALLRATSIIILAALVSFRVWEKPKVETDNISAIVLVDEMTINNNAVKNSLSALLKKIQIQSGRYVLLTYNSSDESLLMTDSPAYRFNHLDTALQSVRWLEERHGPLPIALFSEQDPDSFTTFLETNWDVTWIGPAKEKEDDYVNNVLYPREVFVGQNFRVSVDLAPPSQALGLTLGVSGGKVNRATIDPATQNNFSTKVDMKLMSQGFNSIDLNIFKKDDKTVWLEHLPVLALTKPRVIYVSPFGRAAPLSRVLAEFDFEIQHMPVEKLLRDLQTPGLELKNNGNLIILDSLPLPSLKPEFAAELSDGIKNMGMNLLLIPGSDIGAEFEDNQFENLLPVHFGNEKKENPEKGETLAFVAMVDTSMSMFFTAEGRAGHGVFGSNPTGPVSKIQMAKKALENLSQALKNEDRFGILTVTDKPSWLIKPSEKRDPLEEVQKIGKIHAMGPGINLYSGLLAAYNEMTSIDSELKHILIFLDTADVDEYQVSDRGSVWDLLEFFRKEKITVSLVGFGKPEDPHVPQLNRLADESGGYFYLTSELEEIPGFGLKDLEQIAKNLVLIQNKKVDFFPSDFTGLKSLPDLRGQVITTLKPGAGLYAWTDQGLPLYSIWSYGKGKVGLFAADSGLFLAREWTTAPNREAWLPLIFKLIIPSDPGPDLFYSMGPVERELYVTTGDLDDKQAPTAEIFFSDGSSLVTGMEKIGRGKYFTPIDGVGSEVKTIIVPDYHSGSSGKRVLPIPQRIKTAGTQDAAAFHPRIMKGEDQSGPFSEPEAFNLFILISLTLFLIDEFFRPPTREAGQD